MIILMAVVDNKVINMAEEKHEFRHILRLVDTDINGKKGLFNGRVANNPETINYVSNVLELFELFKSIDRDNSHKINNNF